MEPICNMATLLIKESSANDKLKSRQKNTTTTQTLFTSTLTQTQIRAQQLKQRQLYYQHYHHQNNNNINNNIDNGDDDEKGDQQLQQQYDNTNDFYHIKQFYQPTKIKSIKLLNQTSKRRRNHHITTTSTTIIRTRTHSSKLSHVLISPSTGNCCRPFLTLATTTRTLLILCLLLFFHTLAIAAPQCILCDKNDILAKDPQTNYEEFLFEHQVTRQDAINALRQLNDSFYEGMASDSSCNAVSCTDTVMKYCLGPQFINDHCWCELGHSTEGLPFVPHICYVGEKVYKTSVDSCFLYEEVKECCCSPVLAKEWRHISAGSSVYRKALLNDSYMFAVIFLLYLLIRRSYYN